MVLSSAVGVSLEAELEVAKALSCSLKVVVVVGKERLFALPE